MKIQLSDHFTYQRLLHFCLPSIVMMIFTSIYGVVDGLFVSNFVGKIPFAAINLVMPFIMILGGFGFMIGTGGSALIAKTLGEGRHELANRYFSMLIIMTVILGLILTTIGIVFARRVSILLGATDVMLDDCVIYLRTVLLFISPFMLQNVFQSFLVTAQKPHAGLIVTIIAGLTNMSLDALFIVVFRWGVAGAALATGISQCIGGLLPLVLFLGKNDSLLHLVPTRLEWRPFFLSCTNGMSELMGNISSSIVSMLYNFQLLNYAGENGIAAYGVLMYVQFIFIAVFFGYTIGVGPVIGYHYGAGNHAELKNLFRKSLKLNIIAGISMTILANLFAGALSRIFVGYDSELYAMTKSAFHIFALSFLVCGINIFASAFFTALNNGLVSAVISFLRTLVFQVGSVLILPAFLGLNGICLSNTFADLMAMLISIIFLTAMRKRYHYA
mgnify:FL=1